MIIDASEATKVKSQLKDWESRFTAKYGRKPLKEDLIRYPKVALKYAQYEAFKEKTRKQQPPLVLKTSQSNGMIQMPSAASFFGSNNASLDSSLESMSTTIAAEERDVEPNTASPVFSTPKKKNLNSTTNTYNQDLFNQNNSQKKQGSFLDSLSKTPVKENGVFLTPQKIMRTPSKPTESIDEIIEPSPLGSEKRGKVNLISSSAVSPLLKRKRPFASKNLSKPDGTTKAKSSILNSIPSFFRNELKTSSFLRRISEPGLSSYGKDDVQNEEEMEISLEEKIEHDEKEKKVQEADRLLVQKMVQDSQAVTTTVSTSFRRHNSMYISRVVDNDDDPIETAAKFLKPRHSSLSLIDDDDLDNLIRPSGFASSRPFRRQASMPLFALDELESFLDESERAAFHDLLQDDRPISQPCSETTVIAEKDTSSNSQNAEVNSGTIAENSPAMDPSPVEEKSNSRFNLTKRHEKGRKHWSSRSQRANPEAVPNNKQSGPLSDSNGKPEDDEESDADASSEEEDKENKKEIPVKKRRISARTKPENKKLDSVTEIQDTPKNSNTRTTRNQMADQPSKSSTASNNFRAFKLKPKKGSGGARSSVSRGKSKFAKTPKLKSYNYARTEGTASVAGYMEEQNEEEQDSVAFKEESKADVVVDFIHTQSDLETESTAINPILLSNAEESRYFVNLAQALKRLTGFTQFKPGQETVLTRIMMGKSTLFVSATGSGKSICYQLPAFLSRYVPRNGHSIVLVVSPTISLMNDQLKTLPSSLRGACLSGFDQGDTKSYSKVVELLENNQIDILFVSPEKLVSDSFEKLVVQSKLPPVSMACIDEIHCMSEWSHNFRPSYLCVAKTLKQLLRVRCIVGLTGTATRETIMSICNTLELDSNEDVIETPILRPNLKLSISKVSTIEEKEQALVTLLRAEKFEKLQSIVIYAMFQSQADHIAQVLRIRGFDADSYHAGKSTEQRMNIQSRFLRGSLRILVATVAFGLGINKPDISSVIHYTMPKGLENYVQEIGRSGRNGQDAFCHLFLSSEDYVKHRSFAYGDGADIVNIEAFLSHLFPHDTHAKTEIKSQPRLYEIAELERLFDMKETVLSTLVTYLSLDYPNHIQYLGSLNAEIQIFFTKSKPEILMEDYPFISSVLETSKRSKYGYVCRVEATARHAKISLDDLLANLKELQRLKLIRISGTCKSFYIRTTTTLKSKKHLQQWTAEIAASLHERISRLEKQRVFKLDQMYSLFYEACGDLGDALEYTDEDISSSSHLLQTKISDYFEKQQAQDGLDMKSTIADPALQTKTKLCKMQLEVTIKTFVKEHVSALKSGRVVARIFHGLSSPQYPYSDWSRNRHWGTFAFYDFSDLSRLAEKALTLARSKASKSNHQEN